MSSRNLKASLQLVSSSQCRNKSKSASSTRWLYRQKIDPHVLRSRTENYRSRAAYKLAEILKKYRLINKKTKNIVDLGFAPGSWSQVVLQLCKSLEISSHVVGVDVIDCPPPQGAHFIKGDILSNTTHQKIRSHFAAKSQSPQLPNSNFVYCDRPVDLILSDMMAKTSGNKDIDHFASMELCDATLLLACLLLSPRGCLVLKYFAGKEDHLLQEKLSRLFKKLHKAKPDASRPELREMYFIAIDRRSSVDCSEVFLHQTPENTT